MRVLMTADAVGGIWSYADELARALHAEGCEVTLVALGPCAPPDESVPHRAGRLEWQEDPWDDVEATRGWLLALAEDVRPDVLHLNSFSLASAPWRVPTVVAGHSCVCSWFESVRGEQAPTSFDRYRAEVRRGLRAADAVVAPTRWMLGELRRHYGLRGGELIHNGVRPPTRGAVAHEPLVLAAGRLWDEAKGLDALDGAAAHVAWRVEVAGDTARVGAEHAVLLGELDRDQLRERMARAAIFAHPARYEPFGLAPLEAGLAGCALVLGNIPTMRELWNGAALFVPPGDAQALACAIEVLARDDALRERLGHAARSRAERYDAGAMARAYARLYTSLLSRAGVAA